MAQQPQQIELTFPFKGVHESSSVTGQPDGTTGRALNVRGYDSLARRDRGGQRPGLVRWTDSTGTIPTFDSAPIDAVCQMTQTVPVISNTLAAAKLNRQWVPLGSASLTSANSSASISGMNDIAVTLNCTFTFKTINDIIVIDITPDVNPNGYLIHLIIAAQAVNGFTWFHYGVAGDGSGGGATSINVDFINPPPLNTPVNLVITIRQGGIWVSSTSYYNGNNAGWNGAAFTADQNQIYDWLAAGPHTISMNLLTFGAGTLTVVASQTQLQTQTIPLALPYAREPDGTYNTPEGIVAGRFYVQKNHAQAGRPNTNINTNFSFMQTEAIQINSQFQWTVAGTANSTPWDNPIAYLVQVPDETQVIAPNINTAGYTYLSLAFNKASGTAAATIQVSTPGNPTTFNCPSSFKNGAFTVVCTLDGNGNLTVVFNGVTLGTVAAIGATITPGLYCLFFNGPSLAGDNSNAPIRWTGASLLTNGPNYAITRETILVACGGDLFISTDASPFAQVDTTPIGGGAAYDTTGGEMSICAAGGYYWIVDGSVNLTRVNGANAVIDRPAASAGTLPTNARVIALYRDRLFFSRFPTDPFNYVASKSGDYLNFDASDTSVVGAFAGNNALQAGLVGEPITALIPYGDQTMIMGMANSVAVMRGDPKAGGSIDTVSREVGVAGPTAWARDPDGNFYFMAKDGLYSISGLMLRGAAFALQGPTGMTKPMSRGRLDATLGEINFAETKVLMGWDPREFGLKVYLLTTAAQPTTVVYWEQRKDAFWIDQYPAGIGPTAVAALTGQGGDDRKIVLGGWDGVLRNVDLSATDDDGSLISSLVQYTPAQPMGPLQQSKLISLRLVWGAAPSFNATYGVRTGDDALVAVTAPLAFTNTNTAGGYQSLDRTRCRGGALVLEISNDVLDATWQIERCTATVTDGGRIRT